MKVRLTREAEADLERIGDFIAQDNPQRALTFIAELREKCLTLANSPDVFPLLPRYQQFGVRRRIHGNYLIFYAVDGADRRADDPRQSQSHIDGRKGSSDRCLRRDRRSQ